MVDSPGDLDTLIQPPPAAAPVVAPAVVAPVAASGVVGPTYAPGLATTERDPKDPNAENRFWPVARGGPLGSHGFIRSTWLAFAAAHPEYFQGLTQDQILAKRTDEKLSGIGSEWYAGVNAKQLAANGIEPTPQNLAIAHALGGGGASSALRPGKYADTTPLSQIFAETQPAVASEILRMNPSYQKMNLGQLRNKYAFLGTTSPVKTAAAVPPTQTPAATPLVPTQTAATSLSADDERYLQMRRLALLSNFLPKAQATTTPYTNSITPWAHPFTGTSPMDSIASLATIASLGGGNSLLGGSKDYTLKDIFRSLKDAAGQSPVVAS